MSQDYNTEVFNAHARAANWDKPGAGFKHDPFDCGMFYVVDFRNQLGEMTYFAVNKTSLSQSQAGNLDYLLPQMVSLFDSYSQPSGDEFINSLCNTLISLSKANGLYAHWLKRGETKFHAVFIINSGIDDEVNISCELISSQDVIVDANEVACLAFEKTCQ